MEHLLTLSLSALQLVIIVSGPVLLASMIVGFGVSMLQGMTQIQDFTLSFVPKLIAVSLVIAITAKWIGSQILRFTLEVWGFFPT
ncbi:MAG: flagellar biosynthetic protein FliQ [Pseudomonadota bacterium]